MSAPPVLATPQTPCWLRVGVCGDLTCPELARWVHCHNCPTFVAGGRRLFERAAAPDYLEQWAGALADPEAEQQRHSQAAFVFRVQADWFGMDASRMLLVADEQRVHQVPHRSDNVLLGLTALEGELHLCYSLAHLLQLEEPTAASGSPGGGQAPRFILWEHEGSRWVFPADEVFGIQPYSAASLQPVPDTLSKTSRAFTKGLLDCAGRPVALLDHELLAYHLKRTIQK